MVLVLVASSAVHLPPLRARSRPAIKAFFGGLPLLAPLLAFADLPTPLTRFTAFSVG